MQVLLECTIFKIVAMLEKIKCMLWFHDMKKTYSRRYDVTGVRNGHEVKTGEVTLSVFKCKRCGKETLVPSDRVYYQTV